MHVGVVEPIGVSYCLGITDICPIELDLYFERFLNETENRHQILISIGLGVNVILF
jgi:hypothetical protein